mmetsp:Transcript_46588/g.76061  ORF Transcript_46588/g.76061 Transcript_46588/m.76061 type:complete len:134 (-) Transcript_46588:24-425(-)
MTSKTTAATTTDATAHIKKVLVRLEEVVAIVQRVSVIKSFTQIHTFDLQHVSRHRFSSRFLRLHSVSKAHVSPCDIAASFLPLHDFNGVSHSSKILHKRNYGHSDATSRCLPESRSSAFPCSAFPRCRHRLLR